LQIFAEASGDLSIKEVAAQSGLAPSTVHRLLKLLSEDGIIEFDPSHRRYFVGNEFIRIASLVASKISIADIAKPYMNAVVENCDETCVLISYNRARKLISVVGLVSSSNPLRYQTEMYTARSPLWGATGQSVVAFLPREEQEALYDERADEMSLTTHAPLPPKQDYLADMDAFRRNGYAISHGQTIIGAVGIGAPIYDRNGQVTGSLCVSLPQLRSSEALEQSLAQLLIPQARAVSAALGFHGA
jgi:DNA-binding IclR family transcriptional regulator